MIADIFVWHFTLCCFRSDHYQVNLSQCQALRCGTVRFHWGEMHSSASNCTPKPFVFPSISATLSLQRLSAGSVGRSDQRAGGSYPLARSGT